MGIGFILFISIFYIVGFAVLFHGLKSMQRSNEAGQWPTVSGTLKECSLDEIKDDEGSSYRVEVEYEYQVNGKGYTGDTLAFGYASSNAKESHSMIHEKLKSAKTVDVRYDPADPEIAVLSYGVHQSIKTKLAFAVTWLAFVFGFTLTWWMISGPDIVLLKNLITQE